MGACQELGDDPNAVGAGDEIIIDWNRSVDFTAFQTFGFVEAPSDPENPDSVPEYVGLNESRFRDSIRKEFGDLEMTESETPDLEVVYMAYSEDASELTFDCVPYVYWHGYYGGYDSCAFIEVEKTDFEVGTVILGFGDASNTQIVYQAIAQGIADGQDVEARIESVVRKMFYDYPVGHTGS